MVTPARSAHTCGEPIPGTHCPAEVSERCDTASSGEGCRTDASDGEDECGLAFVCYSASIIDGFEFIQRTWCNAGAEVGLVGERDPLLQQGEPGELTGMVIPASDNGTVVMNPPPKPFVTVRGCEYLFVPSRKACEWLMSLA